MKRYVDVKKCYKKNTHIILYKQTTKSHAFVVLSHLFSVCADVV